jgi:hypothetical protein
LIIDLIQRLLKIIRIINNDYRLTI